MFAHTLIDRGENYMGSRLKAVFVNTTVPIDYVVMLSTGTFAVLQK